MFRSFFLCLWVAITVAAVRAGISLETFRDRIASHVGAERFAGAMWGIRIDSLDSGACIFETNAHKLLKPASNAKLYTGAMALDRFGPDERIRTSLYSTARPDAAGLLDADLIVYGRGDPSFSARFNDGNYDKILDGIVATLKKAGIRSIQGDLVGDETYFTGPRAGSTWAWDDLIYYYGAEASALSIQDNVIDLVLRPGGLGEPCSLEMKPESNYLHFNNRTVTTPDTTGSDVSVYRGLGSREVFLSGTLSKSRPVWNDAVAAPNPALWFVSLLADRLQRENIVLQGKVRRVGWPEDPRTDVSTLQELGFVESRPMSELLAKMLKPSQNLYAQLLLLQAGAREAGAADTNLFTETLGLRAMKSFVTSAGIEPGEVLLEEGSGLSRGCLVTPRATVQLLKHMARHRLAQIFLDSLAEPGEPGTLRRRLLDFRGNLRAKTGTIRFVNTLSGYLTGDTGEHFAFCLMLNAYNPRPGAAAPRDELDFILRQLRQVERPPK